MLTSLDSKPQRRTKDKGVTSGLCPLRCGRAAGPGTSSGQAADAPAGGEGTRPSRTFSTSAAAGTNVYGPASSGQVRNALTVQVNSGR